MMNRRLLTAMVALLILVAAVADAASHSTVVLTVSGMHCEGCASGIESMVKRVAGVIKTDVSYKTRQAVVRYDAAKTSPQKIIAAIEKLGYKAAVRK